MRAFERLLGSDRSRVHEVWGSSGGAMLGYAFAHGHDLSAIEELGYLLYHGKAQNLPGLDVHTAVNIARRERLPPAGAGARTGAGVDGGDGLRLRARAAAGSRSNGLAIGAQTDRGTGEPATATATENLSDRERGRGRGRSARAPISC